MKKLFLNYHFWVMGLLGMVLGSCSNAYRISEKNASKKIYNLKYGSGERNVMDVFLPENYTPGTTAVMIIHGGAWVLGNKTHLRSVQNFLFKNNIPTVAINYTLLNGKTTYQKQMEDIGLAVDETLKRAPEWKINPEKLIVLGESAGGHLGLLYGFRNPDKTEKLISMSGPTDFYSDSYMNSMYYRRSRKIFEKVVGQRYNQANMEAFQEASPLSQVANIPTLIFQGDRDFLVNKKQGLSLDSVMTEKRIPHRLVYMKNSGHVPRFIKKKREQIIFPAILEFIKEKK